MRILITGSSGFIGKHVVNYLTKVPGIEVIELTHSISIRNNKNTYKQLDLKKIDKNINLFEYFNKPEILIHLAWWGLPNYNNEMHVTQVEDHYSFIKNLLAGGLKKVVITGTCQEYGMREGCLSETIPIAPHTNYAKGKNMLRLLIEDLAKTQKFEYNWIRLFYMYGLGQNLKSILPLLENAINNNEEVFNMSLGDQKRDYLKVEIVAEYISRISLQNKYNGVVNCCSGHPITVISLVEDYIKSKVAKINLNRGYYKYPDYEPVEFWGNNVLLNQIINN